MTVVVILVVFILLLAALASAAKRNIDRGVTWPVYAKRILSNPEQVLFGRLVRACPNHYVLAQVALSQMIGTKKGKGFQSVRNRYSQLVADFVVCRKDFSVEAVVELDDKSHDGEKRKDADARKTGVLDAAGIRLIRVTVTDLPDERALAQMISPSLEVPEPAAVKLRPVSSG